MGENFCSINKKGQLNVQTIQTCQIMCKHVKLLALEERSPTFCVNYDHKMTRLHAILHFLMLTPAFVAALTSLSSYKFKAGTGKLCVSLQDSTILPAHRISRKAVVLKASGGSIYKALPCIPALS